MCSPEVSTQPRTSGRRNGPNPTTNMGTAPFQLRTKRIQNFRLSRTCGDWSIWIVAFEQAGLVLSRFSSFALDL